ncbi:MAG: hypothetical protein LLG08_03575 [Actinomycetia bacterium]|nr:hypothetical protein [Actinomycetes bacterium]
MEPTAIATARDRYAELYALRAAVQVVPYVGGALDTLLAGGAAKIQMERVTDFLEQLADRLADVEGVAASLEDDAFADLVLATLDSVARSRSSNKRARFAAILSRQVVESHSWDEAERAARLLADLEDVHLQVLGAVLAAPVAPGGGFEGIRVASIPKVRQSVPGFMEPYSLTKALPALDTPTLRMVCAELVGKGLLHDEGIGRLDVVAMTQFVATDLAVWFSEWLGRLNEGA